MNFTASCALQDRPCQDMGLPDQPARPALSVVVATPTPARKAPARLHSYLVTSPYPRVRYGQAGRYA